MMHPNHPHNRMTHGPFLCTLSSLAQFISLSWLAAKGMLTALTDFCFESLAHLERMTESWPAPACLDSARWLTARLHLAPPFFLPFCSPPRTSYPQIMLPLPLVLDLDFTARISIL